MSMTVTISQWLVRITGVLLLILGLLFWTGDALNLVPVHMLLGVAAVVSGEMIGGRLRRSRGVASAA